MTANPLLQQPEKDVLELTWEVFGELCRALAVKVARDYDPQVIVGIARAGAIPGAVVASFLRKDFFSMTITRREGGEVVRERPLVLSAAPKEAAGKRVLIVDEICTTGETLRMALAAVRHVGAAEIRTATSFVKVGRYKPDYYAIETENMVIFPWDRQVVSEEGEIVTNPQYDGLI